MPISLNTQAILLLTAPLIVGRSQPIPDLLSPGDFKRLVRRVHDMGKQLADLLTPEADSIIEECSAIVEPSTVKRLLSRGFLLSQALERWETRAIWVVGRPDPQYPERIKARLKADAPPILYGCGDTEILETGGLAVVGSRDVDDTLIEYASKAGQLAAKANCTIISGGARGVDQAAMQGALDSRGNVIGVLSETLERAALNRANRDMLLSRNLVLISPYDPSAGFNVGHAMQRNKLIYALAHSALVVNSDYNKGGTWAGAVEQLDKLNFVPIYVRSVGKASAGLEALRRKGASPWPNPTDPDTFASIVRQDPCSIPLRYGQDALPLLVRETAESPYNANSGAGAAKTEPRELHEIRTPSAAEDLFAKVQELLVRVGTPLTVSEAAEYLNVSKGQVKDWLLHLVELGVLQKQGKPVRYSSASVIQDSLFADSASAMHVGEQR
ncbi:MAG: DNA-processing protein DprA [Capsulimonadaceae bacterium]